MLPEFSGTIFSSATIDAFLNNIVTSTIVFEGDSQLREYDGGYDDWIQPQRGGSICQSVR
ncbi:MAG: hypothetical protein R3C20_03200 [Planctomycetaceae bacterium]